MEPRLEGMGAPFVAVNRGKQSLAVDLKSEDGRQIVRALAARADVVLDGFRPGVLERLGLGYEELSARNERLIMVAITGFGSFGEARNRPGHDLNYLAWTGLLSLLRTPSGEPCMPGVQFADVAGGVMGALGALLALAARDRSGKGQFVDAAIIDALLPFLAIPAALFAASGDESAPGANLFTGRYACYNLYRTADDRWLAVGAFEQKFWANLCLRMDAPQWIPRQFAEGAEQEQLIAAMREAFSRRPAAEWLETLDSELTCVTLMRSLEEVSLDASIQIRDGLVAGEDGQTVPALGSTPGRLGGHAPRRGEHTRALLAEAGLGEAEIERLLSNGTVEAA
jgi:crotonobetainyl-CoA:carnitine CoA-transferase CaiB-like acyl-CoA transferase